MLREDLLTYTPPANVPVKFRGRQLFVKQISGTEHFSIGKAMAGDATKYAPNLLTRSLVDENGVRVFTDEDAEALGKLPWGLINEPFLAASKINEADDPNG